MPRNFNHATWESYVPNVDDERSLCELGEPCITMEIKVMTRGDSKKYEAELARIQKVGAKNAGAEKVSRMILENHVRNITNYSVNGEPIVSGEDLFDRGDLDIISDVSDAIYSRSKLDKGLEKNLRGRSASSTLPPEKSAIAVAPDAIPVSIPTIPVTEKA